MSLSIIGAGLGRTGTVSLKLAIEQLGIGRCYHMTEVLMNPRAPALWVEAADGRPDWESIFEGYVATVDYPACNFWRELAAYYPSAKVLLSVRDAAEWFESTQATILSPATVQAIAASPLAEFAEKVVFKTLGKQVHDRDFMIAAFNRHTQEVKRIPGALVR
jgi:hypothetical protein